MDMKTRTSWKRIAKRLLVVALVLSLAIPLVPQTMVVSASAVTQAEIDELKDNASDLREQQKELQNQLAAIKEDKNKALEQKTLLEQQINATQAEINTIHLLQEKSWPRRRRRSRPSMSCSVSGCATWRSRARSPIGPSCSAPRILPTCWTTP